ncbi:MAG: TIGR02300 family protein [Hyphomicrobiaceae bacterium]
MATKQARGTKRTCQNAECESRFYDLERDPIICPYCDAEFKLAPAVVEVEVEAPVETPEPVAAAQPAAAAVAVAVAANGLDAGDGDEVTDDDALVSLEDADAEIEGDTTDDEDDNTFLEADDDEGGGDVSDIIGPVVGGDEET